MICDESWKIHDALLITEINNKSFEINDLKAQLQDKSVVRQISCRLKQLLAKLKGKSKVTLCEIPDFDSRVQKLDDENVSLAFQFTSKVVEKDDLSKTVTSHLHTNKELLEQARALKPLDENLDYACKFAQRIQELLVYVCASCPFTQSGNEKWAPATSTRKNNKPYVDISRTNKTVVNNTQKHASKSNTMNDRIHRPSSRSQKNKVEAQLRKFKSSSNKNNHVSDCNANVKNVALSSSSENVCLSCNECLFFVNHDACVVNYLKDVQNRKKAKSVKQKEKIQWKPTGRVFTTVGHRWIPIGRTFSMAGTKCLLTKITHATIVPSGNKLQTISIPVVAPNIKTRRRYSIAKNSLIKAHINCYGHPFNKYNFAYLKVAFRKHTCFVRNLEGVDLLSGSRRSNLYTISMEDMIKSSPVCLLSKALKTKSWLWHRRLSHLNFRIINQLAKQGLVKGLPKLKYAKDHLCSVCQMGKSKKESHKSKPELSTNDKLQILHMDLCGLMRVESIYGKKYILVMVDDYS
ncbi:retrovirus-related pol polyprotein from transposon TNT 1-94 [Tanacetum coccineum]